LLEVSSSSSSSSASLSFISAAAVLFSRHDHKKTLVGFALSYYDGSAKGSLWLKQ
jgi:hypothetical protein